MAFSWIETIKVHEKLKLKNKKLRELKGKMN